MIFYIIIIFITICVLIYLLNTSKNNTKQIPIRRVVTYKFLSSLSAPAAKGSYEVSINDPNKFSVGDFVEIGSGDNITTASIVDIKPVENFIGNRLNNIMKIERFGTKYVAILNKPLLFNYDTSTSIAVIDKGSVLVESIYLPNITPSKTMSSPTTYNNTNLYK
jgi:hypothetical protein